MRRFARLNLLTIIATLFSGCSTMPKVTVSHYLPAASLAIVVTQTATCTGDGTPIVADAVVMTASYRADKKVTNSVDLAKLGSGITKADAAFEFFPDGRLKSVNSKQTGQAGAALSSTFKLVATAAAASLSQSQISESCNEVKKLVGDGKALTLISRGSTDFVGSTVDLSQTSVPNSLYSERLKRIFGTVTAHHSTGSVSELLDPTVNTKRDQGLTLRKTAAITVTVSIERHGKTAEYSEVVLVPQRAPEHEYQLPIQKGPWFGENVFELALDDSGSVTKLRYGGGGDAGAVVDAASEIHAAFQDEPISATDKAKTVQAEADLIYQQHRLVLCQADPTTCPK
ncbi:MAG: hypothetical protein R3F21_18505 [Myxococcota bacterium]